MNAAVTLPPQLTTIPLTMIKINKNVYLDDKTNQFYKTTVLDPLTMFTSNDLITRQNIILTKYDPHYLALEVLAQNAKFSVCSIPKYLKQEYFQPFVDMQITEEQKKIMRPNTKKIMDFLQKRIDRMLNVIEQKRYIKTHKKYELKQKQKTNNNSSQNRKTISLQIVQLLRKEIPDIFIQQLLRTKYHQQKQIKPVVLDNYVEQMNKQDYHHKDKDKNKKKAASKPKLPPVIDKNQTTLLMFSGKKQSKQSKQSK